MQLCNSTKTILCGL